MTQLVADKTTELMAAELQWRFCSSSYLALRRLTCASEQDRVIVRGSVSSFYLKQIAESLALKVAGSGRVLSDILVEHQFRARAADRADW